MMSVQRLIAALVVCVLSLGPAGAFTVSPAARAAPRATHPPTATIATTRSTSTSGTALPAVLIDQAIVEMTSRSDPAGAVFMMIFIVSMWELFTPGRAKKE